MLLLLLTLLWAALTYTPDILIPGTLESGCPRNQTCSVPWACEQGTPPIFFWTSDGLTSLGLRTRLCSVLTLTSQPQHLGINLTCQVNFPEAGATLERTIQPNITCECWARMLRSLRVWGVGGPDCGSLVFLSRWSG
ncbi:hypothetical protein HPG69_014057 [Diceros bicornis minor]|uniref:Ig-like domain-containing protein n=1 Tax=Diceros bicornis minor TaxID=77932 RepID=A0A7J7ENV3_DICBM|nr:hypothetical protein HPG69_014057 [Diceros bicornis minor]